MQNEESSTWYEICPRNEKNIYLRNAFMMYFRWDFTKLWSAFVIVRQINEAWEKFSARSGEVNFIVMGMAEKAGVIVKYERKPSLSVFKDVFDTYIVPQSSMGMPTLYAKNKELHGLNFSRELREVGLQFWLFLGRIEDSRTRMEIYDDSISKVWSIYATYTRSEAGYGGEYIKLAASLRQAAESHRLYRLYCE